MEGQRLVSWSSSLRLYPYREKEENPRSNSNASVFAEKAVNGQEGILLRAESHLLTYLKCQASVQEHQEPRLGVTPSSLHQKKAQYLPFVRMPVAVWMRIEENVSTAKILRPEAPLKFVVYHLVFSEKS
mgnify:CR=1 FL=1